MQYCISYTCVTFTYRGNNDSRESKFSVGIKEFTEKSKKKAVAFYKSFKEEKKKWLHNSGKGLDTRIDFHGLFKIVNDERIMVTK